MASFTIGAPQLAAHKAQAPARMTLRTPQRQQVAGISFGPKLGCNTQQFQARRSGVIRAQRQTQMVVSAAAGKGYKVALLGAAGGIGQPLALLLKMNKYVSELSLYDLAPFTPGVAKDISHCNTPSKAVGFVGQEQLAQALQGADLVVIPAGVPRKPGMTRDDLFNINAGIVKSLTEAIAKHAPNAIINIISNPVNSTVPIAAEVLKAAGVYDKRKLIGVSTLDVVRANTFVAEAKGLDVRQVDVPVIGGHAGTTILPLLSQTTPSVKWESEAEVEAMTKRIQEAGTEVVEAKAGAGSATLSMAYAAARMAESVLMGLEGTSVTECAYVESDIAPGVNFFAHKLKLGKNGVEEYLPIGDLSPYEKKAMDEAVTILQGNVKKGVEFANQPPKSE